MGKTTDTGWMLHALHEARSPDGSRRWRVHGYDADHSRQLLSWAQTGDFPFPVEAAASARFHVEVVPPPDAICVVDCGHTENHPDITDSVLRLADLVLLHLTPSPADIQRVVNPPVGVVVRDMVLRSAALRASGQAPPAWALLNRVVPNAKSTREARDWLAEEGWPTLTTTIGNREELKQSIGAPVARAASTEFGALLTELEERGLIK
jgi:hypothetical protein